MAVKLDPPLPHNDEVDRNLVGCILGAAFLGAAQQAAFIVRMQSQLPLQDVFHDTFRAVLACVFEMHAAGQLAIDVAGLAALSDGVPLDFEFIDNWVRIVRNNALLRTIIRRTGEYSQRAYAKGADPQELLNSWIRDLQVLQASVKGTGTSWRKSFETMGEMRAHGPVTFAHRQVPAGRAPDVHRRGRGSLQDLARAVDGEGTHDRQELSRASPVLCPRGRARPLSRPGN